MKTSLLLLFIFFSVSLSAQTYTGYVYVDANYNGKFEQGEKMLENVVVSDGKNVVKTDRNGRYFLLGYEKERFIFITTPSGYKTNNAYYKRIDPSVKEYNFGVQSHAYVVKKNGSHTFIHVSDTEIAGDILPEENEDWAHTLKDAASTENAAFIVHTGDICYANGLKNHIELMNTNSMNTQVFYTIGNHDLVAGKYGEELFEKLYGPVYYSFDVGNIHYITTPMLSGDYRPSYTTAQVCEWLKNDLAMQPKGKAIVVFNHEIYLNHKSFSFLKEYNLKAWVYGHWHNNFIKKYGETYGICTSTLARGGIDHSSSAYRVMRMDAEGDFISELRYSYINKTIHFASESPMSVNVYSSVAKVSKLKYSCYYEGKMIIKDRYFQQKTDWNWGADIKLPASFKNKKISVEVEAIFDNGEIARAERSYIYGADHKNQVKLNGNWTNLLGNPEHVGIAKDTLIDKPTSYGKYKLEWVANVGSNIFMTSPVLYDGILVLASVDENIGGKASVCAMDAMSGKIKWKYNVKQSVKNSIAIAELDDNKEVKAAVVAQDVEGNLYAINLFTGDLIWEKKLGVNSVLSLNDGLVVKSEIVYAGSGHGLCAIDVNNGNVLWKNSGWGQSEGTTSTPTLATINNQDILVSGANWGAMFANDAKTGKMLWRNGDGDIRHRASSPSVNNGLLYVVSRTAFFMLNPLTGEIVARKSLPFSVNVTSTPILTNNEIIFGSAEDGMIALDNTSLEIKWQYKTGDALISTCPYVRGGKSTIETSPVLSGDILFFGASDGVLYGLERKTGKVFWKYRTGAPIFSTVTISGNALFAADFSGNVYCFTF